jgi:hypothetical protein
MPIPPTCTAKRKSSSLSFGSQTGRARELAGLLVANVACPAFGAVCIPVQCFGETLVGPSSPTLCDGHASSVTAWIISRHRVFPRCGLGFSSITVNTGARAHLRQATAPSLSLSQAVAARSETGEATAPVFPRYRASAKRPIFTRARALNPPLGAVFQPKNEPTGFSGLYQGHRHALPAGPAPDADGMGPRWRRIGHGAGARRRANRSTDARPTGNRRQKSPSRPPCRARATRVRRATLLDRRSRCRSGTASPSPW